jgi:hypothetical protein
MAAQAALEIQRRRRAELEAQVKAAEVAKAAELAKLRVELPEPEKSLEKSLLNRRFGPRMGR